MQHLCPRCRQAIPTQTDGTLSFCSYCGAPQVRVSEELLAAAATPASEAGEHAAAVVASGNPDLVDWRGAIQVAGLAGAIALLLAALSELHDGLGVFEGIWSIAAPIVVLGIYSARFKTTRIGAQFGARLGLLCGAAIMLAQVSVFFVNGLLLRFVFHTATEWDTATAQAMTEWQNKTASLGGPDSAQAAAQLVQWWSWPEFRAGALLTGLAMMVAMYLAFSATGGAFAGFLRSRKPAQS